jgi:hypothetical protein
MSRALDRWESLKAGLVGAGSSLLLVGLMGLVGTGWTRWRAIPALWPTPQAGLGFWVSGAIAALAGFLFAVTYRYVIREDQNPHLKSGAVGAFGLVRGLAQVDVTWQTAEMPWRLLASVVYSLVLFAVVQVMVDRAIAQHWIQPFPSTDSTS